MIIDFDGPGRVVTGPRGTPLVYGGTGWRHGVSVGLTPAGASALLRMPARELAGAAVPLEDVLGGRAGRLADRLGEAGDWAARFAVLDERLWEWLAPDGRDGPDGMVTRAWWRLQDPASPTTIGRRTSPTSWRSSPGRTRGGSPARTSARPAA